MHKVLILGAGKIGTTLAQLLARVGTYHVYLADRDKKYLYYHESMPILLAIESTVLDIYDLQKITNFIHEYSIEAIISCLPYYNTVVAARIARNCNIHYFDFTEDVSATKEIYQLARGAQAAFVPQCGVAPGFINIIANSIMQSFDELDTVKLRVGALPATTSHSLRYALTWSTDGIINEYANACPAIVNGQKALLSPLHGLEQIILDGGCYEAFSTSGGVGGLVNLYLGKVKNLDYKTLRYPGHCEKMRFLMEDLKLNEDRATLKKILESAIPKTYEDVVISYITVRGKRNGEFVEESYFKKLYPKVIEGIHFTAIQITTAAGAGSIIDKILNEAQRFPEKYSGYIHQEYFSKNDILNSPFGNYFQ